MRKLALLLSLLVVAGCAKEHEITLPMDGRASNEISRINASNQVDRPYRVDGKPFSGVVVGRRGDQVVLRVHMRDGRKHGVTEWFYNDGTRQSREEVAWDEADGVRHTGDSESWCENGERRSLTEYSRKGQQELARNWDCETGKLVAESRFDAEGRQDGQASKWAPSGTLIERASWKAGALHGDKQTWAANGTLLEHARYREGKRHGLQETWHANGKPATRGEYADDKPVGPHETRDENGRLVEGGSYAADGSKTGLWLERSGDRSTAVQYGPGGFVPPELLSTYATALWTRPNPQTVAFYLDEGKIKLGDALPASYNGDPEQGPYQFPVRSWTYPVIFADDTVLPLLLERGANIDQTDSEGRTRLLRCVERYRYNARNNDLWVCSAAQLQALLDRGAKASVVDRHGRNALHHLLNVAVYDDRGDVFGHGATEARQARVALLAALVKAGANANAADEEGYTPLVRALKSRHIDLIKAVLAAGARANAPGPAGTRAVHWLFLNDTGSYDIRGDFVAEALPLLVAAGADVNAPLEWDNQRVTLRDLAVRHGLVDLVRLIEQNTKPAKP
ncbi:hypothetical protein [Thermomonas sp.]|uniref:hypothetical protein n=1 Tax=Thermomonas sp. TaxID=1971895 RepID=UPI00262CD0AA|nr:hypothetical protein [Thermomonas sp.]